MEPFGKRLKDKMKKERLSVADLAEKLGLEKPGNIYKWQKGVAPTDSEDLRKVKEWLDLNNLENKGTGNLHHNMKVQPINERDLLIESLRRNIQYLEQTVQANLISISDNIIVSRATIRAAIDYQLMKDSKGDEKKRVVLLEQINKLIHLQLTGGRKDHSVGV
jgi:transcriptional regulator with XRE-family HTH domain